MHVSIQPCVCVQVGVCMCVSLQAFVCMCIPHSGGPKLQSIPRLILPLTDSTCPCRSQTHTSTACLSKKSVKPPAAYKRTRCTYQNSQKYMYSCLALLQFQKSAFVLQPASTTSHNTETKRLDNVSNHHLLQCVISTGVCLFALILFQTGTCKLISVFVQERELASSEPLCYIVHYR